MYDRLEGIFGADPSHREICLGWSTGGCARYRRVVDNTCVCVVPSFPRTVKFGVKEIVFV